MRRNRIARGLAVLVASYFMIAPANAGDQSDLKDRVEQLSQQVEELEAHQKARLEQQIESYLADSAAWESADGDAMEGITITANLTGLTLGTIGLDPSDATIVTGSVMLRFDFAVHEKLKLFVETTSYPFDSSFPAHFPVIPGPGGGQGATLSGLTDGIGVDGTVSVAPGDFMIHEAGVAWEVAIQKSTLVVEFGALDPRRRFQQHAFGLDANKQFLNNVFQDSAAILWLTDSTGRSSLGLHLTLTLGDRGQWTINSGWFNTSGQFWNQGQWYIQGAWNGQILGRETNVRLFGFIDEFFTDANGDGSAGGGFTWDWWATDKIGVFITLATNGDNVNPVELDATVGMVARGLIGRRPNDEFGVGFGVIRANRGHPDPAIALLPTDREIIFELYYSYMAEDGRLQITPLLQFVFDPGGNGTGWIDDRLILLGLRIHVPF